MPNYLTMPKRRQILALLALGWSYRRIKTENWCAPRNHFAVRPAPSKRGQNVPRLRPTAPGGFARSWRA